VAIITGTIPQAIHLIGISGSGMSALAHCLHQLGKTVSGSDLALSELTEKLTSNGVKIYQGHSRSNIKNVDLIVTSDAIPKTNVELTEARLRNIPILSRSACLAMICQRKSSVMVSGSHGKTTTAAMISWMLRSAGLDPSFSLGDTVPNLSTQRAHIGSGEYFVIEACEAFRNLHHLHPTYAVIANIDNEHLNHYGSQKALDESFLAFANRASQCVILNGEDPGIARILGAIYRPIITFGLKQTHTICAKNYAFTLNGAGFELYISGKYQGVIELAIPGHHVLMNALACIATAFALGLDFSTIAKTLPQFTGVKRRWERYPSVDQFILLDDFAHHPSQLAALADTAIALRTPNQHLAIAFQPQLYSRTKSLLKEFARELSRFDQVLLLEIDGAGERDLGEISSTNLAHEITSLSGKVELFSDMEDLMGHALKVLHPNDFFIIAGTGQITQLAKRISAQKEIDLSSAPSKISASPPSSSFSKAIFEHRNQDELDKTVISLLHRQFRERPQLCAVSEDEKHLTYEELRVASSQIICHLYGRGVRPSDVVAVHLRPSMESVILTVAIAELGAIYLPIDPSTPIDRAQFILDTANASVLITESSELVTDRVLSFFELYEKLPDDAQLKSVISHHPLKNQDLAYICFTSGTTGTPKGISIDHGALANLIQSTQEIFKINHATKMLLHTTLSFDVSLGEIWLTLCNGGELCAPSIKRPLVGSQLGQFIHNQKITHLLATPSILKTIPLGAYPHLSCIVMAGEKCPQTLVEDWAPHRSFFNAYGPTEATIYSTVAQCYAGQAITIGLPIANVTTYIFGGLGTPSPDGETGELYIGGLGLSKGYINLPQETANRFTEYLGQKLYRTGDLVRRLKSGELEYLGRVDNQVKILGNRIELEEIESVITSFQEVADSVVIVDEQKDSKELICFVVLNPSEKVDWSFFRNKLVKWLPSYMIPKTFIPISQILLTPNGKKNRTGLLARYRHRIFQRTDYTEPRTITEQRIVQVWKKFLKVNTEIGMYEDFTYMGGDSLKALELLTEIEAEFNITFQPENFSSISTIWKMAVAVDELLWNTNPAVDQISPGFKSSRLYKGLRYLTTDWHGIRAEQDSLIISVGNNLSPEFSLFICTQYEDEIQHIARSLGDRFHVYGMRSGHLLTDYNAQDTDAICYHYIKEMQSIQPQGKLIIGGICQGGKIAIRINELLREQGITIELLMLAEQTHLPPIDGNIVFFYSEDSKLNPYRNPSLGLTRYDEMYEGCYQIYLIPGVHGEIHHEPQVHLLTDKLKRHLGIGDPLKNLSLGILPKPNVLLLSQAKLIENSGLFDINFYLSQFPQGYEFQHDPAYHYVSIGWHMAYDPCPFFSTSGYLKRAPDVLSQNINPLIHYLHFGISQGREAWTEQDVMKWQQPWIDRPDLAQKIIDVHQGAWPTLTRSSTVMVYAHSRSHMVFHEFQELLIEGFRAIGIECFKGDETYFRPKGFDDNHEANLKIIIAPHEFFYLGGSPQIQEINWDHVAILNSEQLPSVWFRKALPILYKAPYVLDMNIQTAASLIQLGINARFIPLGLISQNKFNKETSLDPESDRDIDILWIGTNSKRREDFIAQNQRIYENRNVFIRLLNVHQQTLGEDDPYSITNQEFIALANRSKILLNVHHFDTPYFEWQRLIHFGLMQGCCVVTETSAQQPDLKPGEHYFEEDLKNLPELVAWLLDDVEGQKMAQRTRTHGQNTAVKLFELDKTLIKLFDIT